MLLGPALYLLQLQAKILITPWYLLGVLAVGVALLFLAVLRKPNVWRITLFLLGGLFAGLQVFFLVTLTMVPAYTGPVVAHATFPSFSATRADGSVFNLDSLRGPRNTALVFFRGRW